MSTRVLVLVALLLGGLPLSAAAQTGGISGAATREVGGAPIQGVGVIVYTTSGTYVETNYTDPSGAYTAAGLAPGSYYLVTLSFLEFVDELYPNVPCPDTTCNLTTGTLVTVTAGATTANIDFALSIGGAVTGTVTSSAGGAAIQGVNVSLYGVSGNFVGSAQTNASGLYTPHALPTGTYYARTFVPLAVASYLNELYDNLPCIPSCTVTTGTPIAVTAGATTSGVNFALALGGSITGTVTDAGTALPLALVTVRVYSASGVLVGTAVSGSGGFTVTGLPTGTYYARTFVRSTQNYVDELYDNLPCLALCMVTMGTPIAVTVGATTSGVNFALAPSGSLTGRVTDAETTLPLASVTVRVFTASGSLAKNALSDGSGGFTVTGLPTGTYYARTTVSSSRNHIDALYDDVPCFPSCTETMGTPIAVAAGATTSGVNFTLAPGGSLTGTVTDAATTLPLAFVNVQVFTASGSLAKSATSNGSGGFTVTGLPTGTFYASTSVPPGVNYVDEVYDDVPCAGCVVTTGTPIAVVVGATTTGVNFALAGGGSLTGTVTDAGTTLPISSVRVNVYNAAGSLAKIVISNTSGAFTATGLPTGTYFAHTAVSTVQNQYFIDEVYDNLPCAGCDVTTGTPIVVVPGSTTPGIDFALRATAVPHVELLRGGDFNRADPWLPFATPDLSYITTVMVTPVVDTPLTSGILAFYRKPPPAGTTNEAGVFQETGVTLQAMTPLRAQFSLGNGTSTRKRISVALVDHDFSDVSVCTFWLPPLSPLRPYQMRTHTTQVWDNAALYVYAETAGIDEYYVVDSVSLQYDPSLPVDRTACVEPTPPVPPGGPDGPELLVNGDFASGQAPWTTAGAITTQVAGGVFEFVRPVGTPVAVVEQETGQAVGAGEILTAQFQLGNSSSVRKRVTVQVRDVSASDLWACTFWLPPGQPLAAYAMRGVATQAWANATLAVYPETIGPEAWSRLDNVTLRRTPSAVIVGTMCYEPGAAPLAAPASSLPVRKIEIGRPSAPGAGPVGVPPVFASPRARTGPDAPASPLEIGRPPVPADPRVGRPASTADAAPSGTPTSEPVAAGARAPDGLVVVAGRAWRETQTGWEAVADVTETARLGWAVPLAMPRATEAWLHAASRLSAGASWAEVRGRTASGTWLTLAVVPPSVIWTPLGVDLGAVAGDVVEVEFVFHAVAPADGAEPDVWSLDGLRLDITP